MIWIVIGLCVLAILIIRTFLDDLLDIVEKIGFCVMIAMIICVVTLGVTALASKITTSCVDADYKIASDTKIIALKDNQNISGNFYIMGGYVDEDLYYYYATETEFGYKTEKIKAGNAYIKYTDGEPHIEKYSGEFANDGAYFWGIPMYGDRYIIYCPDGTVTNEFNVDLE